MILTDDQKRAAEAAGSVAVTAGAGTGKTSMLAARYLHHVKEHGMSPLSVVAVTFTEKAADELRSRIRKTLSEELGDEKVTAEVEAAQISTMHALASRICRDFYDLAGIPADFAVLDDTEKPLWVAEKFEEAIGHIEPTIIEELGFTWLTSVLQILLRDPFSAEKSLALGSAGWRDAIDEARESSITDLIASEAWQNADFVANDCSGKPGDKLEQIRADVSAILAGNADVEALHGVLKQFRANLGAAGNWSGGELERLRECFVALKNALKEAYDLATLRFGPEDELAASRIGPLAIAFKQVRDFIATEKIREKILDFGDLERYALKVLEHPKAVEHYGLRWRAYLVDEFQDTNPIQADILGRLTLDAKLTIVGDEKQAIYGFRGADIGVFSRVREQIVRERAGEEISLSVTFRTHHELVMSMNRMFEPVLGDLHQPLIAKRPETNFEAPHLNLAVVEANKEAGKSRLQFVEARYIADRIAGLRSQGVPYKDIAILARTWAPLDVYLDVLTARGIPAVHAGGGSLLATREASDIYALLCFLIEPNDDIPLVSLLRSPFFAVSDRVLFEASKSWVKGISWWHLIAAKPEFAHPVSVLNRLLEARSSSSSEQIVRLADSMTGYGAVIANLPHGSRRAADLQGLRELFRKLERQGKGDIFGTTRYLKELIETETEIARPPLDTGEAVSLMTIHKSKGLEWPVVFIPDLGRGGRSDTSQVLVDADLGVGFKMDGNAYEKAEPAIFKLMKAKKSVREKDEARRLLYVAVTRARDMVYLTATKEKGSDLDILLPGLDAAGVAAHRIAYDDELAIAPSPGERSPYAMPSRVDVDPVTIGSREIPVTALTTYAKCPLRFKFQHIDGHPGLSEGFAFAMAVGSLTHIALEHDINDIDRLRLDRPENTDEQLAEAVALANRFRIDTNFETVRSADCEREKVFTINLNGVRLNGVADLVGPDFVLDYKTDAEMEPAEHRFQLWAYAKAFERSKAFIAYLRQGMLHEFATDKLALIEDESEALLAGIYNGEYEPKPSERNCSRCPFNTICFASVVKE
ncbi:hypothetical protein BH10ACI2_BH10ACI2_03130 [soil metagenome]